MLIDSYIRRKRWEYREQAIAHFAVYGEAMGKPASKQPVRPQRPSMPVDEKTGIPINTISPPIAAMLKLGMGM